MNQEGVERDELNPIGVKHYVDKGLTFGRSLKIRIRFKRLQIRAQLTIMTSKKVKPQVEGANEVLMLLI